MAQPASYFTTAPVRGSTAPFRVWVVGDSGTGGEAQAEVRDAMLSYVGPTRPDLFLHVGDMAYADGTDTEFTLNFFGMYEDVLRNTTSWPALGNHEGHTSDSSTETGPYYDAYVLPSDGRSGGLPSGTEAYYAFDYGNVHFIVLDSHDSSRAPGGPMLTWLREDLDATDAQWVVAYWHHPPYSKGSHDSDSVGQLIEMRENVLPILEAHNVDLVLAGHSHIYERSYLLRGAFDTPTTAAGHVVDSGDGWLLGNGPYDANAGTVYVVAGHGGAGPRGTGGHPVMFMSELANGSVILDANGPSLTVRNIRRDGVVSDEVTLVKGEDDAVVLISPLGGETVSAGGPLPVRWVAPDSLSPLRVELSVDDGATWLLVADDAINDGLYEFFTPRVRTEAARVRVSSADRPEYFAESGTFALVGTQSLEPVSFGSRWEYHDDVAPPEASWSETLGEWPTGTAQLGYGDGDEATALMKLDPNVPTVYFRKAFDLGGTVTSAELDVVYDDAIAVFLNGVEVLGVNLEAGEAHDVYAGTPSTDDATARTAIDGALFRDGENIVAALVKQADATSSDLSFDLRLRVDVERDLPLPDGAVELPDAGEILRDAATRPPPIMNASDGGDGAGCGCRTGSSHAAGSLVPGVLALLFLRRKRYLP